jgi:hypothetical protein
MIEPADESGLESVFRVRDVNKQSSEGLMYPSKVGVACHVGERIDTVLVLTPFELKIDIGVRMLKGPDK